MKNILFLALTLSLLTAACKKDTGLTQAGLQNIYSALSEDDFDAANKNLVEANHITSSPLISDAYTKQLYGQLYILNTIEIGEDKELVIYQLEEHERSRKITQRLKSDEYLKRKANGEVKTVDEENGIIVFTKKKYAFKVLEGG
jgi:hypothetical protein